MDYLSRDDILSAEDREYAEVDCPEWGGTVRLRSISGMQRDAYEQSLMEHRGKSREMNLRNARAKLIILCAVDAEGRRLFTEADLQALGRKNAKPLDRLFDACQKLAGISSEDVDRLTENFDEIPDDEHDSD